MVDRLAVIVFRFLQFIVSTTPIKLHSTIERIVALTICRYRSDIVRKQLKTSFKNFSGTEINQLQKKYYRYLSRVIIESLWAFSSAQKSIVEKFLIKNPEEVNKHLDKNRSVLMLLGHVGNWEWGQASITHYIDGPCVGVYKPLSNASLNQYIYQQRSKFGVLLLKERELLKYIAENYNTPQLYILIADQYPTNKKWKEINFLNQITKFDLGPEKLAEKYDLEVVYAHITNADDGRYLATLKNIERNNGICECYISNLEQNILEEKASWLWSHRRWR